MPHFCGAIFCMNSIIFESFHFAKNNLRLAKMEIWILEIPHPPSLRRSATSKKKLSFVALDPAA